MMITNHIQSLRLNTYLYSSQHSKVGRQKLGQRTKKIFLRAQSGTRVIGSSALPQTNTAGPDEIDRAARQTATLSPCDLWTGVEPTARSVPPSSELRTQITTRGQWAAN